MKKQENKNNTNVKITEEYIQVENQLKKALADYTNLEKDIDRKIELRTVQLKTQLALQFMEIFDAIELAIKAKESMKLDAESLSWVNGVLAILAQLDNSMESMGIKKMLVKVGDEFNSTYHEALAMVPGGEKNKIHEVVGNGYQLGEYVVRPARVIVYSGNQ